MEGRAHTDGEKILVMQRVLETWRQHPEMRLGQMLIQALRASDAETTERRIFYVEDVALAEVLERWEPR